MKIPKDQAGLFNWGSGSKPKLSREAGGGSTSGNNVRNTSDEDARCERRPSRSYRRPSNERERSDRDQREHREHREQREHRERDSSNRREKEPSVGRSKEPQPSSTNNKERERERGSEIIKNKNSKTMRYNPGPLTRNPYLNFMREFRKHNTGENILDITKQGAKAWHSLPIKDKEEFANQARRVPQKVFRRKKKQTRRRFF